MNQSYRTVQTFPADEAAIKSVLGLIYPSPYWGVVDRDEDLIMLHYEPTKISQMLEDPDLTPDMKDTILRLRGLVIDTVNLVVVSVSFGYTSDAKYNQLPEDSMLDSNGMDVSSYLTDDNVTFHPALEGATIRVWKYKGRVYYSTHKKINPVNSTFGTSPRFLDLFSQVGGPDASLLFESDTVSSNLVHCFMMCHSSLLMVSKIDLGKGFVLYLGPLSINPEVVEESDISFGARKVVTTDQNLGYPKNTTDMGIWLPNTLTKEQANQVLSYGPLYVAKNLVDSVALKNSFLRTGEPVIAIKRNSNNEAVSMCRIVPSCYEHKMEVVNHNPIFLNQSFLINDIANNNSLEYQKLFPFLSTPTIAQYQEFKSFLAKNYMLTSPQSFVNNNPVELTLNTDEAADLRIRNALMIFILCLPLHAQEAACDYYSIIQERKKLIYNFISSNWSHFKDVFVTGRINVNNSPLLSMSPWSKAGKYLPPTIALERLVKTSSKGKPEQFSYLAADKQLPTNMALANLLSLLQKESGLRTYQLSQAIANFNKRQNM